MTQNPWKWTPEDREQWSAMLAKIADQFREQMESPHFVRPYPHCLEDVIICFQEAGAVEAGTAVALVLNLLGKGEPARSQMIALLVRLVGDHVESEAIDFRSRFEPGKN